MEQEEIKNVMRVLFLKKFTEEIIINLSKKEEIEKKIKIERLKRKFNKSIFTPDEAFKKVLNHKIIRNPKYMKNTLEGKKYNPSIENPIQLKDSSELKRITPSPHIPGYITQQRKAQQLEQSSPVIQKRSFTQRPMISPIRPMIKPLPEAPTIPMTPEITTLSELKPEYHEKPKGFFLGKIEMLLQDPFIQSLECPGPGKNILIKKYNQINVTKMVLSKDDINEVIENFSKQAKIPLAGGILKAAVGDLVISAVTSEFAGSRFIINRLSPHQN